MGKPIASGDTEAGSSGPNHHKKNVEILSVQFIDKVVNISVNVQVQVPTGFNNRSCPGTAQ